MPTGSLKMRVEMLEHTVDGPHGLTPKIDRLQNSVTVLQGHVTVLRGDVTSLRTDLTELRMEFLQFREEARAIARDNMRHTEGLVHEARSETRMLYEDLKSEIKLIRSG